MSRPDPRPLAVAIALSAIAALIVGATLASLAVYLHDFRALAGGAADFAAGAFLLGMAVANMLAGLSVTRFGVRATVVAGVGLVSASWWGLAHALGGRELTAFLLLAGAGVGLSTIVPGCAFISRAFAQRAGLVLAGFIGACALASAVAPLLVAASLREFGWRSTCNATAVLLAAVGLPLALSAPAGGARRDPSTGRAGEERHQLFRRLLDADYALLVVASLLAQLSLNGILLCAIEILQGGGLPPERAVQVYSCANLVGVPALFVSGLALGKHRAKTVFCAGLFLQTVGTLALLGVGRPASAEAAQLAFILCWGAAGGIPAQAGPVMLARLFDERVAPVALGLSAGVSSVTGSIAPVLAGALGPADARFGPAILAFAGLAAAAVVPLLAFSTLDRAGMPSGRRAAA